ncbi:transposase [Bradyrhizobium sp. LB7.2]
MAAMRYQSLRPLPSRRSSKAFLSWWKLAKSIAAFHTMIRKKAHVDLDPWLERACASLVESFANGVTRDKPAINAAIKTSWSNGQTEGPITKLKLVKRQMYGRAKLDLLQARLIGAT